MPACRCLVPDRKTSVPDTSILRSASRGDPSTPMQISSNETVSHLVQFVMPHHVNPGGITFGGQVTHPLHWLLRLPNFHSRGIAPRDPCLPLCTQVLAWVEEAAYLSAVRLNLKGHMVTASMDAVSFKEPTTVGAILYFTSMVSSEDLRFWRHSLSSLALEIPP